MEPINLILSAMVAALLLWGAFLEHRVAKLEAKEAKVVSINGMDSQSFSDFAARNSAGIGNAAAKNLRNVHGPLAVEIGRIANLETPAKK